MSALQVIDPEALDLTPEPVEEKHVLQIMDHTGDTGVKWDPENQTEVDDAKKTFEGYIEKGYKAFTAVTRGKKAGEASNTQITEFDPNLGIVVLVPPFVGG